MARESLRAALNAAHRGSALRLTIEDAHKCPDMGFEVYT